jgi:hypothetical protein
MLTLIWFGRIVRKLRIGLLSHPVPGECFHFVLQPKPGAPEE